MRRRASLRWALDAATPTGLGWLAIQAPQAVLLRPQRVARSIAVETEEEFSAWADTLWQQCGKCYGMLSVRDAETLRILYPKDDERFIRLKVSEGSRLVGWAVLLDTRLAGHRQFGDMRLGSIVSALASPGDAPAVIRAATALLESRGVDLIVSNQSHAAWCHGFRRAGFLRGPSNFIFASSRQLAARLRQAGVPNHGLRLNRGDGDGPINL